MKKAFTLIELLVVVLIIGVLSAIALPQYNIAVNKTHFSNYRTVASSIARSAETYYLANGNWPDSFDVLDVNLPPGMTTNGTTAYGDKIFCKIQKPSFHQYYGQIYCADKEDYTLAYTHMYALDDGKPNLHYNCSATSDMKAVCQSLGGKFYIQQGRLYYYTLPESPGY